MTTGGWQLFKEKYLHEAVGLKDTFMRIAKTAAQHTDNPDSWAARFFDIMWRGWLAPSTPVLSNMGTIKGMPVSCSGQYIHDSIDGFYSAYRETALLTKNGFGTSGYLGDVRPRGAGIRTGGKASGILPIVKHFVQDMRDVAQGTSRRGAWAGYVEIEHGDFWELIDHIENFPDDLNIGWNVTDNFIQMLESGNQEATKRYQRIMKVRAVTGKGYLFKVDETNRHNPPMYKDLGLAVKASNLCTEITLHSDEDHTFTCVLSSMNLSKYDEWKHTDAVFVQLRVSAYCAFRILDTTPALPTVLPSTYSQLHQTQALLLSAEVCLKELNQLLQTSTTNQQQREKSIELTLYSLNSQRRELAGMTGLLNALSTMRAQSNPKIG